MLPSSSVLQSSKEWRMHRSPSPEAHRRWCHKVTLQEHHKALCAQRKLRLYFMRGGVSFASGILSVPPRNSDTASQIARATLRTSFTTATSSSSESWLVA